MRLCVSTLLVLLCDVTRSSRDESLRDESWNGTSLLSRGHPRLASGLLMARHVNEPQPSAEEQALVHANPAKVVGTSRLTHGFVRNVNSGCCKPASYSIIIVNKDEANQLPRFEGEARAHMQGGCFKVLCLSCCGLGSKMRPGFLLQVPPAPASGSVTP